MTRTRSRSEDRPTLPGPAPHSVPSGTLQQWNTSSGGHSPIEVYEQKPNDPVQSLGTTGMHLVIPFQINILLSISTCMCHYVYVSINIMILIF